MNQNFSKRSNVLKDLSNEAMQDYKKLCNAINVDYKNVVKTNQEHTDNIAIATNKINQNFPDINLDEYSRTDGIITQKENLVLSTTNADCILILFFDPGTKTIANSGSATTAGQGIKAAVTEDEMNLGTYGIGVIAAGGITLWCLKRKKKKI